MKNLKLYSLFFALVLFSISACNKIDNPVNIDTSSAETEGDVDDSYAEADGVTQSAMTLFVSGRVAGEGDTLISCATKTFDLVNKSITIDFGTGCQGFGGRVRKGKIIITYTARFFLPGAVVTTTFDNFYINDKKIEGVRTLTNIAASLDAAPKFHVVLQDGKVTWPDSTFATRVSDFTTTWTRAANPMNDETSVEGTASGTDKKGNQYTMDITSPLIYKMICRMDRVFIAVSGKKEIKANGQTLTFDFGDGACDRLVTISMNGVSRTIEVTKGK